MKLRIKGNSLRLRISQPEMNSLLREGEIEDTIHFGPAADAKLTYALRHADAHEDICLDYQPQRVTISLSTAAATRWARSPPQPRDPSGNPPPRSAAPRTDRRSP